MKKEDLKKEFLTGEVITGDKMSSLIDEVYLGQEEIDISSKELQTNIGLVEDEINSHKSNLNNPHKVTTEQIGTYDKTEVDNKILDELDIRGLKDDSKLLPEGTDLNTVVNTGFYNGKNLVNAPYDRDRWFYYLIIRHDADHCIQTAWEMSAEQPVQYNRTIISSPDADDGKVVNTWTPMAKGPIELGLKTDLNKITEAGEYYCLRNADAVEYTNCPTAFSFSMSVYKTAGCVQVIREYNNNIFYARYMFNNTWYSWAKIDNFHSNRVNNPHKVTAAQVGAYTKAEVDAKLSSPASMVSKVYDVPAELNVSFTKDMPVTISDTPLDEKEMFIFVFGNSWDSALYSATVWALGEENKFMVPVQRGTEPTIVNYLFSFKPKDRTITLLDVLEHNMEDATESMDKLYVKAVRVLN